ncbi:MAG: hypothetical protein JW941_07190 [Candidatus Coatesbacteria bacterium]|nr:hypothetical protein [Candidatus Coatesbacteria bacterium]
MFTNADYYQWADSKSVSDEDYDHTRIVVGRWEPLYSISPGYNDTMGYRLAPSVVRHEYGMNFRRWLDALLTRTQTPPVKRIWMQSWDEVEEGICLTDTLEHGKFYMNAIPVLKSFSKRFNAQNKPEVGHPNWSDYARSLVCAAYWAVFGPTRVRSPHREIVQLVIDHFTDGQGTEMEVFEYFCHHHDNLKRWPPVISLDLAEPPVNTISENGVDPSFVMKVSYKNFGRAKCLNSRFMLYLPLRVRDPEVPFNQDKVFRLCAYVNPRGWDEENPDYLRVALCPNRLEFRWPFYHTGEEYDDPPKEFFVKVTGNEIKRFFRRAIRRLRRGELVDRWEGIGVGNLDHGDDVEIKDEDPSTRALGHPAVEPNCAEAPFHGTFSAHFAEASLRFYEGNLLEKGTWIRIPTTDSDEVWYGDKK